MVFTVPNKPTPESWEFFDLGGKLNQRRFYKPHGDIKEMKNKVNEYVYNPVWAKRFANTKGSLTIDADKVKKPPSAHEEALDYLRQHLTLSKAFRRGLDAATENNSLVPGSILCNEDTLATPHSIATTDRSGEPVPKYHRPSGGDPRLATPHMNFWKRSAEEEGMRKSSIVPPLDLKMRRRPSSVAGGGRSAKKFTTNSDRGPLEPLDTSTLERVESFKRMVEAGDIMKYLPDERVRTALGTVRKRIEVLRTGKDEIKPPQPVASHRSTSRASQVQENSMADLFDLPPTPVTKKKDRSALTPTTLQARTQMLKRIYHPMTPQGLQKFDVGSSGPPVELLPAKISPNPVESVRPFEAI